MPNLINAERISIAFGTRILLDEVSLGLATADVIGVVGRNGDGKTTLLRILTDDMRPDSGQVIRSNSLSLGYLDQGDNFAPEMTIRDAIIAGQPDHVWAADARSRKLVERLLGGIGENRISKSDTSTGSDASLETVMEFRVAELSGGERRRVSLTALLLAGHDLLVLDEPTNHLDVEAISWLADYLNYLQAGGTAMLVVSHDRWFLDAICNRIWEVHDAVVDAYEGGYAAYVLARAERARIAAANESRRQNILRKELAWLRRGPPARTSKPKFRIDAANALIADEPDPRDKLGLKEFSTTRLGKDVFDLFAMTYSLPEGRVLFDHIDWSIGPGERIALIGVNGSGKSTLLNLLDHQLKPQSGKIKQGKTLRIGYLSQSVGELDDDDRVLQSVERLKRRTKLATGRDASASSLLEEFGFTGNKLTTRIGDLSGGERRRLQLLRLLLEEPNVLLLDEPTNDLDIDTLQVIEDYLDSWPGTLICVSHDRYFLERVCDVEYALLGDGRCVLLPGGVSEYLDIRSEKLNASQTASPQPKLATESQPVKPASSSATQRQAKKDIARIEGQLAKLADQIAALHIQISECAADYERLLSLSAELEMAKSRQNDLETKWLTIWEDL